MINTVVVAGNLTREPKVLGNKGTVLSFAIAHNKRIPDGQGGYKDKVSFFNVTKFGTEKQIQYFAGALKKGMKVTVQGELNQNVWDNNGVKNYDVQIIAEDLDFFHTQNNRDGQGQSQQRNQNQQGGQGAPYSNQQDDPGFYDNEPGEYDPNSFYKEDPSSDFADRHAGQNSVEMDPY